MARRCPDAIDPRPAVLRDHDWLINERGVATVEPFAGTEVHGVRLAALRSRPGRAGQRRGRAGALPARPADRAHRRRTVAGAWVYIDHRVTPGRPGPGYLERIIDGAVHHGLPQRWIDFLHRWDPARWPLPMSPSGSAGPQSLSSTVERPRGDRDQPAAVPFRVSRHSRRRPGTDDRRHRRTRRRGRRRVGVCGAPSRPAIRTTCRRRASILQSRRGWPSSSTTSTSRCRCTATAGIGRSTQLLAGGRNRALAAHVARHVDCRAIRWSPISTPSRVELRGLHPDNPVNRVRERRHPARIVGPGQRHEPAQSTARR